MGRIVGIDLGTTTTLAGYWDIHSGTAKIIPSRSGAQYTASVVSFTSKDGTPLVGEAALRNRILNPTLTVSSAKRLMGRYYSEIADTLSLFACDVVPGTEGEAAIRVNGDLISPDTVASIILREVCEAVTERIGDEIEALVVGVPAYFSQRQREATRRAVEKAGFRLARLIIEPVAASLFYNWTARGAEKISVVIDLGGGTYDVTVLGYGAYVNEVLAVNGDRLLGGNDFDERIVELVIDKIKRVHGHLVDWNEPVFQQRLLEACITAKCELSERESATVLLPYTVGAGGGIYDLSVEVKQAEFESVCEELFERLRPPVANALSAAGIANEAVHSVMFVGSATRMRRAHGVVRELFPSARFCFANPGEAVALGAAVQAGIIEGSLEKLVHIDAIPFAIGIEDETGRTIEVVPANTSVPLRRSIWITNSSSQSTVEVHVLQGSAEMSVDNVSLGRIVLDNVQPLPRGCGIYRVDVDINVNFEMCIALSEEQTGLSKSVIVST